MKIIPYEPQAQEEPVLRLRFIPMNDERVDVYACDENGRNLGGIVSIEPHGLTPYKGEESGIAIDDKGRVKILP